MSLLIGLVLVEEVRMGKLYPSLSSYCHVKDCNLDG
jgi:hypothetical protein